MWRRRRLGKARSGRFASRVGRRLLTDGGLEYVAFPNGAAAAL